MSTRQLYGIQCCLAILLAFLLKPAFAQFPCGTKISPSQEESLREFNKWQHQAQFKVQPVLPVEVPVKLHIIRNSDGSGGLSESKALLSIDSANHFFINAGIRFTVCGNINYINNDGFTSFEAEDDEDIIAGAYDEPRVINIYFADSVSIEGVLVCGFAYLPEGPLRMFITNFCANLGNTVAHELGHIFSLIHTHGPLNDVLTDELVDGSNCDVAGDEICDTPADPNLNGKVTFHPPAQTCVYTGRVRDANGDLFDPLTDNVMSYTDPRCSEAFTSGQYERIYNSLLFYDLINTICTPEDEVVKESQIINVFPNPFGEEFTLLYQLETDADVKITMYDAAGREVERLFSGRQEKGLIKLYYRPDQKYLRAGPFIIILAIDGEEYRSEKILKIF